jgi:hypothetical protein
MVHPPHVILIFNADAHPDVRGPRKIAGNCFQSLRPLRQDLILVPIRLVHYLERALDVFKWYIVVKEITHGVDEDPLWLLPAQWLIELFGDEPKIKSLFERMPSHSTEALRESLCITMPAAGADFRTAPYGVPRYVCPFDL